MASVGYLQVHAYTSKAQLPLKDVAVMITEDDGTAVAMRLTDRSGRILPLSVPVPDKAESLSPGNAAPYKTVRIYARLENFETIEAQRVQIFADTLTVQNLEMIPLSELPEQWNKIERFDTPSQNL